MRADLFVHEAADYDAWENKIVEQIAKEDAAFPGKKVLRSKGCTACHTLDGQDLIGPSFKGIWGRKTTVITNNGQEKELIVDEAYIRTCVEDPNIEVVKGYAPMMTKLDVSEEEMTAIIEYLKTLKNGN